jgi:hypothetical protein
LYLALFSAALAGCAQPSSGDPGDDAPTPTQLGVAGQVIGLDGVRILATAEAITDPVDVQITAAEAPQVSFTEDTTVVSRYYRIATDRDVVTPADSPLVIGLPVPEGADTEHLVIMSVASTTAMTDLTKPRDVWVPMVGRYDAAKHIMFSTLFGLTAAGNTFVVASRPDIASPANPVETARAARSAHATMTAHDFYVTCIGFPDDACPPGVDIELALELFNARTELIGLGYPEPRLPVRASQIGTGEHVLVGEGYQVFLVPENSAYCWSEALGDGAGGIYYPILGQLFVCLPFDHTSLGDYASVADHEYFHSEQFAFPSVYAHRDQAALIEGTASMAGVSIHEPVLHRDRDFQLHPLDVNILSPDYPDLPYQSQDLWVFIGNQAKLGLEYLIPVFKAGALPSQISSALPGGDDLHTAYFKMATSNAFEKHETYDDVLDSKCVAEFDLFTKVPNLSELSEGDLAPLSSQMIGLQFFDFPRVRISNTSGDSNIDFNVYEQQNCAPLPDQFQALDGSFYYILLVNTSFDSTAHFKVKLEKT